MKKVSNMLGVVASHVDSALTHTRVTVVNQDRDLRYTSMLNPISGYGIEIIGKTMTEVHGAKLAAEIEAVRKLVLHDGQTRHQSITLNLDEPNVRKHYFDTTCHAVFDDENEIIGITCVSVDLTDIMEAKESLEKANGRLLEVLESALY